MVTRSAVESGAGAGRPTMALPSLPPRLSTAEHAASVLRAQITEGALPPGTRLREEEVAESFGISRNTVREVFRLLAHERLVEHVAYRGVHIRRLGPSEISAMYRTRRMVEPLGVRAVLADPEPRGALRRTVVAAQAAAAAGDWHQVGTGDIEFHRTLVDACDSVHLSEMFEKLLAELRLAFLQLPDPQRLHQPYLARNSTLIDLIDEGREEEAIAELLDYLTAAERDVLELAAPSAH